MSIACHSISWFVVLALLGGLSSSGFSQTKTPKQIVLEPKAQLPEDQIRDTEATLARLNEELRVGRELKQRGSISKAKLELLELELAVTELELESLKTPQLSHRNLLEIAKLEYNFAKNAHSRDERLFQTGSLSKHRLRRSSHRLKLAEIRLRKSTGEISEPAAEWLTVVQQHQLAATELELAKKLYALRAISKSTYQRVLERAKETQIKKHQLRNQQQQKSQAIERMRRT